MSIENIGNPNPQELRLNNYAKNFLRETARWAKFISIVGFVMIVLLAGFSILSMLIGMRSSSALDSTFSASYAGGGIVGFIFILLILAIYFFPILYLYKFSKNMNRALELEDEITLTKGFEYLKSHYKFYWNSNRHRSFFVSHYFHHRNSFSNSQSETLKIIMDKMIYYLV